MDNTNNTSAVASFLREQLLLPYCAQAVEKAYIDEKSVTAVLEAAFQAQQEDTNNPQVHGLKVLLGCADDGLREAAEQIEEKDAMARHTQAAYNHLKKEHEELRTQAEERNKKLQDQVAAYQTHVTEIQFNHGKTVEKLTEAYHDLTQRIKAKDDRIAELTTANASHHGSVVSHTTR